MSDAYFAVSLEDIGRAGLHEKDSVKSKVRANVKNSMRPLKIFVFVLAALLLLEAAVYLLVLPSFDQVKINWSGLKAYSEGYLSQKIDGVSHTNLFHFNSETVQSIIASVSGVESVKVVKRFPDRVFITIEERSPVAMTFVSQNDRTMPVQIDENGVLFSTPSSSSGDFSVPLISGIPVENVPEGMRIPSKFHALMEQVAAIRNLPQNYFAAVSEIHVVPKEYGNYELVLYPVHSRTRILTDRSLNVDALQSMLVMLDVVNTIEPDVSEIDLRYGSFSYKQRRKAAGVSLE